MNLACFSVTSREAKKESSSFWLYSLTLHVDYSPSNMYDIAVLLPCWVCRLLSMDTRFQTLDEQIEVVQNQIFEPQYGKED